MTVLLDECVPVAWRAFLTDHGHEVTHWAVSEQPGAPDAVVMAWAEAHDCALVTCDTDFGQMYWREQRSRPSIIQLGAPDWLPDQYGEAVLEALVACETDAPQCYFVRITSSAGYLLRRLPLS